MHAQADTGEGLGRSQGDKRQRKERVQALYRVYLVQFPYFFGWKVIFHYWAEPVPYSELFWVKPVKKSPCNITLVVLVDLNCVMCISIQNNCNMLQTNLTQLQLLTHKCIQLIQIAFSCCRLSLPISPFSVLYCLCQYHLLYRNFDDFWKTLPIIDKAPFSSFAKICQLSCSGGLWTHLWTLN